MIQRNAHLCQEEDPEPSFKKLLTRVRYVSRSCSYSCSIHQSLSHDLHRSYVKLHSEARKYKEQYRSYVERARISNRPTQEPQEVEMNNFQDPQVREVVNSV